MLRSEAGAPVTTRFPGHEWILARIKMGSYIVHAFSDSSWLQDVDTHPTQDAATIFGPDARITDFTGYYLCGPDNPAYEGKPDDSGDPSMIFAGWEVKEAEFLPSAAGDWPPWPWPMAGYGS